MNAEIFHEGIYSLLLKQRCLAPEVQHLGGSEHPTRTILSSYPDIRLGSAHRYGSLETIPKG
jgi:hypothetical protein